MGFKPVEFEDSPTLKDVVTVADYLIRYDAILVISDVVSHMEELLYVLGSTEQSWSSDRSRFSTFCRKLVMRKSHLKLVFCISEVISHFATVL